MDASAGDEAVAGRPSNARGRWRRPSNTRFTERHTQRHGGCRNCLRCRPIHEQTSRHHGRKIVLAREFFRELAICPTTFADSSIAHTSTLNRKIVAVRALTHQSSQPASCWANAVVGTLFRKIRSPGNVSNTALAGLQKAATLSQFETEQRMLEIRLPAPQPIGANSSEVLAVQPLRTGEIETLDASLSVGTGGSVSSTVPQPMSETNAKYAPLYVFIDLSPLFLKRHAICGRS